MPTQRKNWVGSMTEQFVLVPSAAIEALAAEVRQMREELRGARIHPAPQWLSISDAAKALNVHRATITRKIDTGELEARGSGKLRRVKINPA